MKAVVFLMLTGLALAPACSKKKKGSSNPAPAPEEVAQPEEEAPEGEEFPGEEGSDPSATDGEGSASVDGDSGGDDAGTEDTGGDDAGASGDDDVSIDVAGGGDPDSSSDRSGDESSSDGGSDPSESRDRFPGFPPFPGSGSGSSWTMPEFPDLFNWRESETYKKGMQWFSYMCMNCGKNPFCRLHPFNLQCVMYKDSLPEVDPDLEWSSLWPGSMWPKPDGRWTEEKCLFFFPGMNCRP